MRLPRRVSLRFLWVVLIWLVRRIFKARFKKGRVAGNVCDSVNKETDPILTMSAVRLAALIRSREKTSTEIVSLFLDQIAKVEPHLNCMAVFRRDKALEEALEADRVTQMFADKRCLEMLPPLHGVPLIVKECFETPGEPWSAGVVKRKDVLGTNTATAVARMKAAGVIILGKGNTSENCMWIESSNHVYGRSNNPYDTSRTCGGSSGGQAALVSACGAPWALGSDVGGSIRIPAYFNGVFGHKPTGGAVPNTHTWPPCHGHIQRLCQLGPIARHAEDLLVMLRIISGPDGKDTGCHPVEFGDPATVSLANLQVLYCDEIAGGSVFISRRDPGSIRAEKRAVAALENLGCKVKIVKLPEMKEAFDIWAAIMASSQLVPFRQLTSFGKSHIWVVLEVFKCLFGLSDHTVPALALCVLERVMEWMPKRRQRLVELGATLRQKLKNLIGSGVMVVPSLPLPAPKHNHLLFRVPDVAATCIYNALEFPVTQVPLGLNEGGLPVGVQVVANHNQDHLCIAVAESLEKEFGGWCPPVRESD